MQTITLHKIVLSIKKPPLNFSSFLGLYFSFFWLLINRTTSSASPARVYRCLCLIGLSNCKQFRHDTMKTTSIFTFTDYFLSSATAELYLTLNSFTAISTRQRYISAGPNLKPEEFAIKATTGPSTVFGISPFQFGTIVIASHHWKSCIL